MAWGWRPSDRNTLSPFGVPSKPYVMEGLRLRRNLRLLRQDGGEAADGAGAGGETVGELGNSHFAAAIWHLAN